MTASYPASVKQFTTKVDGIDDVMASHVNDLQSEVMAVETSLVSGTYTTPIPANLVAGTSFMSSGTSTLIGNSVERGNFQVGGTLYVSGTSTFRTDIEEKANAIVRGNFQVGGTAYVSGTATFKGDVYTTPMMNWTNSGTYVGWSAFNFQQIWAKRIGNTVFVQFYIRGTSDTGTTGFTLPYSSSPTVGEANWIQFYNRAQDNGTWSVGIGMMTQNSNYVQLYKDPAGTAWTTSGVKTICGQFFFEM